MATRDDLKRTIVRINGKGYKAYKDLEGNYDFGDWQLFIDHVQGDPFASPSRVRTRVPQSVAKFPGELFASYVRRVALEDFLARQVEKQIRKVARGHRGTGKSGLIFIDAGNQEILERTAVRVTEDFVEARLSIGLPAAGRTVLGRECEAMLLDELPRIVEASLLYAVQPRREMESFIALAEDQEFIRQALPEQGLVAFVGNNSILPRKSGISDEPMRGSGEVAFVSPPSLEVELNTPNHGRVRGMGIPQGITLIVGGGYHGKSTLLRALERGVYRHIPGDGREWVITVPDAVKIRAEDGRYIEKVDISPFISNLPYGKDTRAFSTEEASGSTSQAANIVEALEMGARLLLLDEDTSATNFLVRDVRMQHLVPKEKEPITPFLDRVEQLYREKGVSTIMVMGGCGDYFDVATTVIMMDEYRPRDVTSMARKIAQELATGRQAEGGKAFGSIRQRIPLAESFDPFRGHRIRIEAKGLTTLQFGTSFIDLQYVEQLLDPSQTRAIGDFIHYMVRRYGDGTRTLEQMIALGLADIEKHGLEVISPFHGQHPGDYALPRRYEIAAAVNRLRTLRVQMTPPR